MSDTTPNPNQKLAHLYQAMGKNVAILEVDYCKVLRATINYSEFTFKMKTTDNVMDYTHNIGMDRFSTNKFQWKKLNSHVR